MGERATPDEFYDRHGEYPSLVLGYQDDRGGYYCLDHTRTKRSKEPVFAGDGCGEQARCRECKRYLRRADAFLSVTEIDLESA